jgi:acetyltransferase-like isoleucine patch superfamily enzyme
MNQNKVHTKVTDESQSALKRYQQVVVGSSSLAYTVKFELISSLLCGFPGAVGLWLRSRFYPFLLKQAGRGVVIGAQTIVHHPQKISLGRKVAISYGCLLDARGDSNQGIFIGDNVIIGRSTAIVCKDGNITIGNNVGIGANSHLSAVSGNKLVIGDNVLIAPKVYIGGISYHFDRTDIPIAEQGINPQGGSSIGDNVWLGANVTVLDGVSIGNDAIVASGAVVTNDIPSFGIAMGVPAKVVRSREQEPVSA